MKILLVAYGLILAFLISLSCVQGGDIALYRNIGRDTKAVEQIDDQLINLNMELGPTILSQSSKKRKLKYIGINLSGAEFGNANDRIGTTYDYPTPKDAMYFINYNINMFRIPLRWERMQPKNPGNTQLGPEIKYVDALVDYISQNKKIINLDIHNFCRYNGTLIGSTNTSAQGWTSVDQYATFFGAFVARYASNPYVEYTIMNEPSEMKSELWVAIANAAIVSARKTGYKGVLYINGNGWTGCFSWFSDFYGVPNSKAMLNITDPANNIVFDCHNYFNKDNSGADPLCVSLTVGADRATNITDWLRKNKFRGLMGEFGGALSDSCMAAVKHLLDFLEANNDVWIGANWWSAGPKWGNYYASIQPSQYDSAPKNQLVQLEYYANGNYTGPF